jgi:regulator of replication initiation timing
MEAVLDKWYQIKQEILDLEKDEETIRTKIKTSMEKHHMDTLTTPKYKVTLKQLTRETLARKDCPVEVWKHYCKKSEYSTVRLIKLSKDD